MKSLQIGKRMKVLGAALALVAASATQLQAAPQAALEAAWEQALTLAGVEGQELRRPEVVYEGSAAGRPGHMVAEYVPFVNEVRIYQSDRVPARHLLVHEFLHAIYHQTRAGSLSLAELAQEDPSEPWVQERMSRARSL